MKSSKTNPAGSTNRLTINLFSVVLLAVLTIGFFINGCAKQTLGEGHDMKDRNNDGSYNVGYSFDNVISSKSNVFSVESEIKDAYLTFYELNDPDLDPSEQKYTYVTFQKVTINSNSASFALPIPDELDPDVEYKVLILGNYDSNEAGGERFSVFIKNLVLNARIYKEHKRLFYAETAGRLSENLPFSGILQKIGDNTEAESLFTRPDADTDDLGLKVKFTRSVSRFDIINNAVDQLVITKVKVCNYRDEGYSYHSDGFKGSVVSGIEDDNGWLTVLPPAVIGGLGDKKQIVYGGLYSYPNLVPYPAQGDKFTTCLIIEGYYQNEGGVENDTERSYYRANISRDGDPQLLYSNRIYTLTINDVKEAGSVDANVAYQYKNNKLDYETDGDWGTGDDNSSVDEDGNYIKVSRTNIIFDSSGDLYETITVQTKDNANWVVDWEGVENATHFGFKKLDNNYLQVFTKGVNDEGEKTNNGKVFIKLMGDLDDVSVGITLIQQSNSEDLSMLTIDGQVGQIEVDVNKDGVKLRYLVKTGTSGASWEIDVEDTNTNLSFVSSFSASGPHNGYLTIDFEANLTGAKREGYIRINRVPKDGIPPININFTQPHTDKGLIIYSPLGTELEGFRRDKEDVKGYTGLEGHSNGSFNSSIPGYFNPPGSGGGGIVYFNIQGRKQLYVPYNIVLANPDNYTWEATSSFNLKDLGMRKSTSTDENYTTTITGGKSGESVHLFIHVTGPGDPNIKGTLTIKAIPNNGTITEEFEKQYALTITTNCDVGDTPISYPAGDYIRIQTISDRNYGINVPPKMINGISTTAKYYTNEFPGVNPRYKGTLIHADLFDDKKQCSKNWEIFQNNFGSIFRLAGIALMYSKFRPFFVSTLLDPKTDRYVGSWMPLSGATGLGGVNADDQIGYYFVEADALSAVESLKLTSTRAIRWKPNGLPSSYFMVRCIN